MDANSEDRLRRALFGEPHVWEYLGDALNTKALQIDALFSFATEEYLANLYDDLCASEDVSQELQRRRLVVDLEASLCLRNGRAAE